MSNIRQGGGDSPRSTSIHICESTTLAAQTAARVAAEAIRSCLKTQNRARIMVGTGNSQMEMIGFLTKEPEIDWSKVEAFHLDEYVGIARDHPASFRFWIRTRFTDKVHPLVTHYIEGDAVNLDAMIEDYGRLLTAAPIDVAFVGIGENGHIAFNDPHVADFNDPLVVKRVTLDEACRLQQVGEGHFPKIGSVPKEAITVSCRGLFRANKWICCVLEQRKARAIKDSLEGPLSTSCPGTLVQEHPDASVFLDPESASLLALDFVKTRYRVQEVSSAGASLRPC